MVLLTAAVAIHPLQYQCRCLDMHGSVLETLRRRGGCKDQLLTLVSTLCSGPIRMTLIVISRLRRGQYETRPPAGGDTGDREPGVVFYWTPSKLAEPLVNRIGFLRVMKCSSRWAGEIFTLICVDYVVCMGCLYSVNQIVMQSDIFNAFIFRVR